MENKEVSSSDNKITIIFFLLPTIMLIVGYFINPNEYTPQTTEMLLQIPIFIGLILLGIGFIIKCKRISKIFKIVGWIVFAFFWSTMPTYLYLSENGDVFNGVVCLIGVYVLIYLAYQEWLSLKRDEEVSCLHWAAGATFIAGIIYFTIDSAFFPELKYMMVENVAILTSDFLNLLGHHTMRIGVSIFYENSDPISIIFSCTAIQAIALFAGMIGALYRGKLKKIIIALLITIPPMYVLNIVRTSSVVYLVGENITSFEIAHNLLSKMGALITLIVLLFITFKILPELYEEIIGLIDLPKRNGPVEKVLKKYFWSKKKK